MSDQILLISATISPPDGVPKLVRTDPVQRLSDYEWALPAYLELLDAGIDGIVFAENSAADLSSLRRIAERAGAIDKVEFLSFSGNDHPVGCGRNYGEFKLIEHAMAHSQKIADAREPLFVWKSTGRYVVRNFAKIIDRKPGAVDLYCNCRNYPVRWADMYLMGWTRKGYRAAIEGTYPLFDERKSTRTPEMIWRDRVDSLADEIPVVRRFSVVPVLEGHRGLDNARYRGTRQRLVTTARQISNILTPWLWI